MLELVVKEGKLCQQIGVALIPRSQAQMLLKLSAMGFPRPTWGVQRAVWHVAEMLQEHNPQLPCCGCRWGYRSKPPKTYANSWRGRRETPVDGI